MRGRRAAAAPRRHPQSAWPASPGRGLPTLPQEPGRRGETRGLQASCLPWRPKETQGLLLFRTNVTRPVPGARPAALAGAGAGAGRTPGGLAGAEGPRSEAHIKARRAVGVRFPQLTAFPAPPPAGRAAPAQGRAAPASARVPAGAAGRSAAPRRVSRSFRGSGVGVREGGTQQDPTTSRPEPPRGRESAPTGFESGLGGACPRTSLRLRGTPPPHLPRPQPCDARPQAGAVTRTGHRAASPPQPPRSPN